MRASVCWVCFCRASRLLLSRTRSQAPQYPFVFDSMTQGAANSAFVAGAKVRLLPVPS
jgi:hypothetical protein